MNNQETSSPRNIIDFGEAIKTCFHKYADFSGRATRAEFWWFQLFIFLVAIAISVVDCGLLRECDEWGSGWDDLWGLALDDLWIIAMFLPSLAVGARRLHDIGNSGWWQLLTITFIGFIPLIIMWCLRSSPKPNQYGDPPA